MKLKALVFFTHFRAEKLSLAILNCLRGYLLLKSDDGLVYSFALGHNVG